MTSDVYKRYTEILSRSLPDSGRARAYVCYARPGHPSNRAAQHPGIGDSPRAAALAACYWAGDAPWVRVVPISEAPKWAIEAAEERCPCGEPECVEARESIEDQLERYAAIDEDEAAGRDEDRRLGLR